MSDDDQNSSQGGLISDLSGMGKVANSKLANKGYDDLLSESFKEFGAGMKDVVAGMRLFTAPFLLMAAWHSRIKDACEQVRNRVPKERRVEAPPEVAGPVLQSLVFVSETNPVKEMYLNLLERAIDRERQSEAHPAFARIIDQLSPDEAMILVHAKREIERIRTTSPAQAVARLNEKTLKGIVRNPEHLLYYNSHLIQLGFGKGLSFQTSSISDTFGLIRMSDITLEPYLEFPTDSRLFTWLFMQAVVPSLESVHASMKDDIPATD